MSADHINNNNDISQIDELLDNVKYAVGFQYSNDQAKTNNYVNVLYLNIRGLKMKLNELVHFLSGFKYEIKIVVLVESWVRYNEVCLINIPGYKVFHSCRDGRGGGICVLMKENLQCSLVYEKDENKNNFLVLKVLKQNLHLISIYRCPGSQIDNFLDQVEGVMERFPRALVVGDFNLNILDTKQSKLGKYLDIVSASGFMILNKVDLKYATRISSTTSTIIDHVLTDKVEFVDTISLEDVSFSDHGAILINLNLHIDSIVKDQNQNMKIFNYNLASRSTFWDNLERFKDLGEFVSELKKFVKYFTYVKHSPFHSNFKQPWMTNQLHQNIKLREKYFRLKLKHPECDHLRARYFTQKALTASRIRKAKRDFYAIKLTKCNGNAKEFWKLLKFAVYNKIKQPVTTPVSLKIEGLVVNEPATVANAMNKSFVHACDFDWPQINVIVPGYNVDVKLELSTVSEEEVAQIISSLNPAAAGGWDGISTKFLQFFSDKLKGALTKFINKSFLEGVFPKQLKIAKIVPIYKDGDPLVPSNYRPISVLSSISKVYEKIVNLRLINFLKSNKILAQEQYGFTDKSSTQVACLELTNFITENMDKKKIVACLFLDLRKAFDSVDHDILLIKLRALKLDLMQLSWFRSYLTSRPQTVAVNQVESDFMYLTKGVPQGSILGPVLFNIYINDVCQQNFKGTIQLYADDAVLKYNDTNLPNLFDDMQYDLNLLNQWLNDNRLQLNAKKTKYMLFTNKINSEMTLSQYGISCDGVVLEQVNSFKYLGLLLDHKLNWNHHIDFIKARIRPYIFSIKRLKQVLPHSSLILIYNSFILPQLVYLNPIWSGCAKYRRDEIEVLQKRALKHIYHLPPRYPTIDLFKKVSQLRFAQLIEFELLVTIYKILKGLTMFHRPLLQASDMHSHGTRQRSHFRIEFFKTNTRNSNVLYKGLNAFNTLPSELKEIENLYLFKKCLKTYIKINSLN